MLVSFLRTVTVYFLLMLSMRLMGKRQLGDLQPGELVITIIVSDLAVIPITDTGVPFIYGLIPLMTLVVCELTVSALSMRFPGFRHGMLGSPMVLIEKGKVIRENMRRLRFTLDDLLGEVRNCGCSSFAEVAYAIVETDGKISIIPTDPNSLPPEKLPRMVICDGKVMEKELTLSGIKRSELEKAVKDKNLKISDVFYCFCLDKNTFDIAAKDGGR